MISLFAQAVISFALWKLVGTFDDATAVKQALAATLPFLTFPIALILRTLFEPKVMAREEAAALKTATDEVLSLRPKPYVEIDSERFDRAVIGVFVSEHLYPTINLSRAALHASAVALGAISPSSPQAKWARDGVANIPSASDALFVSPSQLPPKSLDDLDGLISMALQNYDQIVGRLIEVSRSLLTHEAVLPPLRAALAQWMPAHIAMWEKSKSSFDGVAFRNCRSVRKNRLEAPYEGFDVLEQLAT